MNLFLKIMKGKNSHVFLLKKVGGALIRVGALNRDYTVIQKNVFLYIYQNSQGPCNKHSGSKYNSYEDNYVILDQKLLINLDIFHIIYILYI